MIVTVDNVKYKLTFKEIKVGDKIYNPFSEAIMIVDEDDDLTYLNHVCYKVK